jgi:membrane protease YdiL (CAAX protease family)
MAWPVARSQKDKAIRFFARHPAPVVPPEPAMASQLLIVASTFLFTWFGLGAVGVASAGPFAVGAGLFAIALTRRRQAWPWASIGLDRPASAWRLAGQSLLALLAGWSAALAAMVLATRGLGWAPIDASRFAALEGDVVRLAGMLALSWTCAAFGEEVLFRGFLQSRLRALFGVRRQAGVLAALAQALLFGLAHAYQGPTGMLMSGAIGLAFGLLMLRFRSLWPLVLAHGVIDTVSMLALFAGARPG